MAGTQRMVFDPAAKNGVRAETAAEKSRGAGGRIAGAVADSIGTAARQAAGIPGEIFARTIGDQDARVQARAFIGGLLGIPDDPDTSPVAKAVALAAPAAPAASRAASVAAKPVADPRTKQMEFLDRQFSRPLTMREAAAYSNMLPAPARPGSAKDAVFGQAAAFSQSLFQQQIAQATELAKTDPEAGRALTAKAMEAHFQRQAGLVGFNPMSLAQAQMLQDADEDN
jgi:hypothetical protein